MKNAMVKFVNKIGKSLLAVGACVAMLATYGCTSDSSSSDSSSSGTTAPSSLIGHSFTVTVQSVNNYTANAGHLTVGQSVTYTLNSATSFSINGGIVNDPSGGLSYSVSGNHATLTLHYPSGQETFSFSFSTSTQGGVDWTSTLNSGTYASYSGLFSVQ